MPLIFAVFPVLIIEALVFWAVASWLGLGWALFLMFALMAVGLLAAPFEMRRVGALAARQKVSAGRVAGDYGLLTAGAILAGSPGIASSIVGLLLILPPTRALVRGMLAKKLLRSIEDLGVRTFEALDLPTPAGTRRVTVRGILADYGNERGSLILDRPVFLAWFQDARVASLALYLKPGESAEAVATRLRGQHPGLQVRSNGSLRAQVTTIFHQTFAITYALEGIGLVVATLGLAQGLTGLALARRGEIWSLRALGATQGDLTRILLLEGLGVALAGLVAGLGLGLLLSRIPRSSAGPWASMCPGAS